MRKAKKSEKLALVLWGVCITLIFLELSLRLTGSFSKDSVPREMHLKPNTDKEVYRIICLGDSWTNDRGLDEADNYPAQLEKILNSSQSKRMFKVYNLGFPNFNSTMVLRKFKNAYAGLRPDAVVVMMGRSDYWNFTGIDTSGLWFWESIKLLFLQSKIGELTAILKYNFQYKLLRSKKIGGIFDKKETKRQEFKSFYEFVAQGNMYRSKAMFNEAVNSYERALNICPDHTVALLELSRSYKLEHKYDLAVSALLKVLETDSGSENIFSELDDIFIQQKQPKKTVDFYRRLFFKYPENEFIRKKLTGAFIVFADDLSKRELFKQSAENYIRALALDPDNADIHDRLIYNRAILQKGLSKKNITPRTTVKSTGLNANSYKRDSSINKKRRQCFSRNLKEFINICTRENIQLIFSSYPKEMTDLMQENAYVYNIPIVDQRPAFEMLEQKKDSSQFFKKDGHCSKEGYRVVAENIALKILDLVLRGKKLNGYEKK